MRHVELVTFENDSILYQKALSLSIDKISFRQLTSLSNKPEYLHTTKSKQKKKNSGVSPETQTNNNIMVKVLSQIKSLYKKKESKSIENLSDENKNYSTKIQLTSENMLNIIPLKTK